MDDVRRRLNAFQEHANKSNIYTPEVFWKQMEECKAADYSNILYIRMLWKDLEPEGGKYAWIYNERYKWYIQKAKDKRDLNWPSGCSFMV